MYSRIDVKRLTSDLEKSVPRHEVAFTFLDFLLNPDRVFDQSLKSELLYLATGFPDEFRVFGYRFPVMVGETKIRDFLCAQMVYKESDFDRTSVLWFQLKQGLMIGSYKAEFEQLLSNLELLKPWAFQLRDHQTVLDQVIINWAVQAHLSDQFPQWVDLRHHFFRNEIPSVLWPSLEQSVFGFSAARFSRAISVLLPVRQIDDAEKPAIFAVSSILEWLADPSFPDKCLGNDVFSAFSVNSTQLLAALYPRRCRKEDR